MDDTAVEDGLNDPVTQLDVYPLKGLIVTSSQDCLETPNADVTLPRDTQGQPKRCSRCRQHKPITEFHLRGPNRPGGRNSVCKWCQTVGHAARTIGVSLEALETYVREHDGRCDCCGRVCRTNARLCVDHSHRSGLVRALLCNDCNVAAGRLGDDWRTAQRLADIMRLADEVLEPAFAKPPILQIGAMP